MIELYSPQFGINYGAMVLEPFLSPNLLLLATLKWILCPYCAIFVLNVCVGGWEYDLRSVQLFNSAEPGVWLPSCWPGHCWSEGGGGAFGQEVSSHGGSGAPGAHRTHQNTSAEKKECGVKAGMLVWGKLDLKIRKKRFSVMISNHTLN